MGFGPGNGTILKAGMPQRTPKGVDLKISCPLPCENRKECLE